MGTSLTGLTPSTTYDALIKVGDNGPLSATAKVLSDGLGNDSPISMSTSNVGIGTNTPTTKLDVNGGSIFRGSISGFTGGEIMLNAGNNEQVAFSTNGTGTTQVFFDHRGTATGQWLWRDTAETRMTLTTTGLGIGTTSPNFILQTAGTTGIGVASTGVDGVYTDILSSVYSGNNNEQNAIQASVSGVASDSGFRFQVSDGFGLSTQTVGYQMNKDRHIFYANGSERVRVTTSGLTFNGDTSASNALDDYEEGTWTATLTPSTSGSISLTDSLCSYTKIGNQVTVKSKLVISTVSSPVGTLVFIGGLPFTTQNSQSSRGAFSICVLDASAGYTASTYPTQHAANTTNLIYYQDASTVQASDEVLFTATYFV